MLRWGPGYSSEEPLQLLHSVEEAEEVLMDRWTILLDHQDLSVENQGGGGGDQFLEPPKVTAAGQRDEVGAANCRDLKKNPKQNKIKKYL